MAIETGLFTAQMQPSVHWNSELQSRAGKVNEFQQAVSLARTSDVTERAYEAAPVFKQEQPHSGVESRIRDILEAFVEQKADHLKQFTDQLGEEEISPVKDHGEDENSKDNVPGPPGGELSASTPSDVERGGTIRNGIEQGAAVRGA